MKVRQRNTQLIRALKMIERLKGGRGSLATLAAEYGVSERTIRRDMEALSCAGVQIRNTADAAANGMAGFWWIAS